MINKKISSGTVHELPEDMRIVIDASDDVYNYWEDITPLARNEFICWIISAKKEETRERRIRRMCQELSEGKRRPCCWPGSSHR